MELKFEEVQHYKVDYSDLDDFINHHFFNGSGKFNFVANEEASNDSSYNYHIDGKVDDYEEKEISEGKTMYMACAYLNAACKMGLIPPGDYLVD